MILSSVVHSQETLIQCEFQLGRMGVDASAYIGDRITGDTANNRICLWPPSSDRICCCLGWVPASCPPCQPSRFGSQRNRRRTNRVVRRRRIRQHSRQPISKKFRINPSHRHPRLVWRNHNLIRVRNQTASPRPPPEPKQRSATELIKPSRLRRRLQRQFRPKKLYATEARTILR